MKFHWLLLLIFLSSTLGAQNTDFGPTQFGLRFGYSLELPSQNFYNGQEFTLFEAGHRLTYGGYLNIPVEENIDFSPYFGFEHVYWPKNLGYGSDCSLDSFPTFIATDDTIPGRDFRFYSIAFEPAFRFYIPKLTIFLKVQPMFSLNLRTRYETYVYECGSVNSGQSLTEFEPTELRYSSKLNFGFGAGIVKEVKLGKTGFLALEPGFKFLFTPVLRIRDLHPQGPSFSLYPLGVYLNLSFLR